MRSLIAVSVLLFPVVSLGAQAVKAPTARSAPAPAIKPPAAMAMIREQDLKRDLYIFGGDAMRGREAGTLDEMRASMWVADEMRKIGVQPMGDGGSWFQWWNMRRTRISTISSSVRVNGRAMALWTEIAPTSNSVVDVSGTTVFAGDGRDTSVNVRGRIAVATFVVNMAGARNNPNTPEYNATRSAITAAGNALSRRGAVGVILVPDSIGDVLFDGVAKVQERGNYDVVDGVPRFNSRGGGAGAGRAAGAGAPATGTAAAATAAAPGRGAAAAPPAAGGRGRGAGGGAAPQAPVPILLVHRAALASLRTDGQAVDIKMRTESFESPSTNVIGVVRGTDPKLRDEYVLFSSHQDHDGVRYSVSGDSIWNGADDNGTTSVALLAIARAWVKQPSKRSALFIFHGAEERGLLGSRYQVAHSVVPLPQIAAVLNGDMIGRNSNDTASLLGSQPPHRNSAALVQMALDANNATGKFVIDSLWDRPNHPEGFYFRSDHVPYAERDVPAVFFTSTLHADYHTPRDEPKSINYPKLTRMTEWMYMTGWIVANSPVRPAIDPGFVLR